MAVTDSGDARCNSRLLTGYLSPGPSPCRERGAAAGPLWGTALGGWWRSLPGYLSPGPSPCGERGAAAGRFGGPRWEGGGVRCRATSPPAPLPAGRGEQRPAVLGDRVGRVVAFAGVGCLTPGPSPCGERGEAAGRFGGPRWEGGGVRCRATSPPAPLPAGRGEQRPAVLGDRVGRVVAFAAGLPLPRPLSLRGEGKDCCD